MTHPKTPPASPVAHGGASGEMKAIQIGDRVTADSWEGETEVVTELLESGGMWFATFKPTKGFWRLDRLRKVQ